MLRSRDFASSLLQCRTLSLLAGSGVACFESLRTMYTSFRVSTVVTLCRVCLLCCCYSREACLGSDVSLNLGSFVICLVAVLVSHSSRTQDENTVSRIPTDS